MHVVRSLVSANFAVHYSSAYRLYIYNTLRRMSWQTYVDGTLQGKDGEDGSYMAGIFDMEGQPWAVHPESFSAPKEDVMLLAKIITGDVDIENIQKNGCTFNKIKFAYVRKDESMVCLQRKKASEDAKLSQQERWPLCAFKTDQCIIIRMSKLGADAARENSERVGYVGDHLNAAYQTHKK